MGLRGPVHFHRLRLERTHHSSLGFPLPEKLRLSGVYLTVPVRQGSLSCPSGMRVRVSRNLLRWCSPGLENSFNAHFGRTLSPFTLGYNATFGIIECASYSENSLSYLFFIPTEKKSSINLSPKGNFSSVLAPNPLNIHTEKLRVYCLNPKLNQVIKYLFYVPIRMKKYIFPVLVDKIAILAIERLKKRPPCRRRNKQVPLRPPIVH